MTPPPDRSRRERPTARTPQRSARPPRRKPLDPARRAAFDVLQAVRERDAYPNLLLPVLLRERGISGRDAAFATELTYGSSRVRGLLDAVIGSAANREPETINPVLLDLLRLGTYQLLRTRVDAHAAVSTTVEQAGIEFDSSRAGFVNAVLRTISTRDEQSWVDELAPDRSVDPVGHAAFVRAHPRWVAQSFIDALGASAGELDAALAADDDRPQVHLAARPGVLTADELASAVNGDVGRFSPYAVYLPSGDPAQIPAVRDGQALVQDEGSQLVARALTLAPLADDHGRWLDLCAGPGGKTALLAAIAVGSGARVTAVEPAEHRADLVVQNTRGLPVEVLRVDGRDSGLDPGFDRVLVDAPCTGLGALRRRPDARWRRQPADIPALTRLQRELLAAAIALTRPGGVVLYATCSPHLAETIGVVGDALRRHPVTALDTRPLFEPVADLGDGPYVQLWPHRHGTDAMFAAALKVGWLGSPRRSARTSQAPSKLTFMSGKTDRPLIAPSILAADFARLADQAAAVEGADWLHVDVMDAHFVPNLTIGLPVVESLLAASDIPMDCHLMIENPDRWAPPYAEAGAYNVTFHAEATDNPVSVARDIRAAGAKAGLSIKPGTPLDPYLEILKDFDTFLVMSVEPGFGGQSFIPEVLSKVRTVRKMVDSGELTILVEIDGGINADTIEQAAEAGVDCFVAGSAVYGADDPGAAVEALRRQAGAVSPHLRR